MADYTQIDTPYDENLNRSTSSSSSDNLLDSGETLDSTSANNGDNGNVEVQPVKSDGGMGDVWIKNFIRSENWQPKKIGFYINGQTGYAEFSNVYVSGDIQALTGTIGGFTIGATTIIGGELTLNSAGLIKIGEGVQNYRLQTFGIIYYINDTINGALYLNSGTDPFTTGEMILQVGSDAGGLQTKLSCTGGDIGNFSPGSGDTIDLGTASNYWNEINYKTLIDRGCLGWFDDGVELQDGSKVTDLEAMKSVKKHSNKPTVYGVPMLDYSTMPKAIFKPASVAQKDIYENTKGVKGKRLFKKGEKVGEDGAEMTALISIMFGAIKELSDIADKLDTRIKKLEKVK
jgi:hypothetical protein